MSDLPFEMYLHIFPEPAGVVVANGFGVAEGLEQRTCLQDLLCDEVIAALVDGRQVLHRQLGALSLTRTTLATTQIIKSN